MNDDITVQNNHSRILGLQKRQLEIIQMLEALTKLQLVGMKEQLKSEVSDPMKIRKWAKD